MNKRRSLRERLSTQRALIGLLQAYPSPPLTEMAGMCGYDFMLLDGEHGVFADSDYVHALHVATAVDMLIMIRVRNHDPQSVGRLADMGADVIVVPNVGTPEQATMMARAMEYPPAGTRGMGAAAHPSTRYGIDNAAYIKAPRERSALVIIIESAQGVTHAGDILAVKGVDGVIVGAADLSADLGCAEDCSKPSLAHAVQQVEQAARANGKVCGAAPHPGAPIETLIERGHRLLIVGSDTSLIRGAMSAQLSQVKSLLDEAPGNAEGQ